MDSYIESALQVITNQFENATPTDFAELGVAIVLVTWFCTRFYGD